MQKLKVKQFDPKADNDNNIIFTNGRTHLEKAMETVRKQEKTDVDFLFGLKQIYDKFKYEVDEYGKNYNIGIKVESYYTITKTRLRKE